jgi:hypothetical protein
MTQHAVDVSEIHDDLVVYVLPHKIKDETNSRESNKMCVQINNERQEGHAPRRRRPHNHITPPPAEFAKARPPP